MESTLFDVVNSWMQNDWDVLRNFDIINPVNSKLVTMGHGESNIGQSSALLLDWLDEMVGGMGLIMSDEEMRNDLQQMLDDGRLNGLKEIMINVQTSPTLKVTILNLNELEKSADPEAAKRTKSDIEKMFSDLSYGDKR